MTKAQADIDIVPMVPALDRAGLAVELLVIACTPCAAILAVLIACFSRVWGPSW